MAEFESYRFETPELLAASAARSWLIALRASCSGRRLFTCAISGGRIGRKFLAATASVSQAHRALLNNAHFFWADERCVDPNNPESNFRMANETFLDPLSIDAGNTHRVLGEIDPIAAAKAAAEELGRVELRRNGSIPSLDLVILGMGEDGHIASLFPGTEIPLTIKEWYRPVDAPKAPKTRITMTWPVLIAAERVLVLVSGQGKSQALRDSCAGSSTLPLGILLAQRSRSEVYWDASVE